MQPESDRADARLKWRCRRGMKELDVLLERFLEQRFANLQPEQKDRFERFLGLQDPELIAYLLKGVPADTEETRDVVQQILSCRCR